VVGQFVRHELGYDRLHERADRLYRVQSTSPGRTPSYDQPAPLGPALHEQLPEVAAVVRFDGARYPKLVSRGGLSFYESLHTEIRPPFMVLVERWYGHLTIKLRTDDPAAAMQEIGVRKVFGASAGRIVALLSTDFSRLVVVAFGLGAPLAYVGMQTWLQDFAYHIEIGPGVFASAGAICLLVALVTTCQQALQAALTNPVDTLRQE